MPDRTKKLSIAWHPAFCSAAEFDLRKEKENLCFEPEHNLSREPLRMDLLIIKKKRDVVCNNEIAKIFRQYNVIEYKSPDDGLTIDDFYKTIAYACLYKASASSVNEIPADELTVSVFREKYPRNLIKELISEGIKIEQTAPGIYTLHDMKPFPAQIVVTGELDNKKHAGLRVLSRAVKEEDIISFLTEAREERAQGDVMNINAILTVSIFANKNTYDDLKRRNMNMSDVLREFMKEEIEAEKIKSKAEGKAEGRIKGLAEGMTVGKAEGKAEGKKEKAIDIALNMLKANFKINDIASLTGLTPAVIKNLML